MGVSKEINFIPSSAGLVVEWYEKDTKESSIVVPKHLQQEFNSEINGINEVLAVGPLCSFCKPGDWVMLNGDQFMLMVVDGIKVALLREGQIAGKFPGGKPVEATMGVDHEPHFKTKRLNKKLKEFSDKVNAPTTKHE